MFPKTCMPGMHGGKHICIAFNLFCTTLQNDSLFLSSRTLYIWWFNMCILVPTNCKGLWAVHRQKVYCSSHTHLDYNGGYKNDAVSRIKFQKECPKIKTVWESTRQLSSISLSVPECNFHSEHQIQSCCYSSDHTLKIYIRAELAKHGVQHA